MTKRRFTSKGQTAAVRIGVNAMPPETVDWFAGRRPMPITALAHPDFDLMPEWWAEWCKRNPGARPPSDAPPTLAPLMFRAPMT